MVNSHGEGPETVQESTDVEKAACLWKHLLTETGQLESFQKLGQVPDCLEAAIPTIKKDKLWSGPLPVMVVQKSPVPSRMTAGNSQDVQGKAWWASSPPGSP